MDIQTPSRIQLIDITASLNTEIARVGIETGMAMVYSPHTTTAIIINENEPGITEDILKLLNLMVPPERYAHDLINNNARSHLQAVVLGNNVCMPVENGELAERLFRGTGWSKEPQACGADRRYGVRETGQT